MTTSQKAKLAALYKQVLHFVAMDDSGTMKPSTNVKRNAGKAVRAQKRTQPVVTMIESDNYEEESEGVSEFEATPAFKKQQSSTVAQPMRITRSQRKSSTAGRGRKRTTRQAEIELEVVANEDG